MRATEVGTVLLRRAVGDVRAIGNFQIDGQRIDARAASLVPPELAGALDAVYVDVEGSLEGAVLRATQGSDP